MAVPACYSSIVSGLHASLRLFEGILGERSEIIVAGFRNNVVVQLDSTCRATTTGRTALTGEALEVLERSS